MPRLILAALAGGSLCGAVHAQTYEAVADWLKVPAGRATLGPMHGDIAVSPAGEHLYGVSLRGQKLVKITLGGEVVLEIARVAPNGDLYVTDGYSSDYVHRFDSRGKDLETLGGKGECS